MQGSDEKLLNIAKFHLGKNKAETYVKQLAKKLGISIPKGKDFHKDLLLNLSGKQLRINFSESIRETQENGEPHTLQLLADSNDRYLAPSISMAMGKLPKGMKAEITSNSGKFSKSIPAPGLNESPEISLANDILYFRKMTCDNSSIDDIGACARYFRSYLLSCISLIDCFLSRYNNYVKSLINDVEKYKNTSTLASTSGIEKRIEAWFVTFAYHEINNYKKSTEWLYFQRIKSMRNIFVHPPEPIASYSVEEMEKYLNYCNKGIGGLLGQFRSYTNEEPNIGFIHKVKTAPKVTICVK